MLIFIYLTTFMKKGSTLFLRSVIVFIAVAVGVLLVFILPRIIVAELQGDFDYLPILVGMYIPSIPFFIALFQGWKLLDFIDKNRAFSTLSINALRKIKYCGFIISALYAAGMPYIFMIAERDDAPGVALIGLVFTFGSFLIGTAAAIFQKMFQNALDIKSENDLTV
jgi:hypothetical protein